MSQQESQNMEIATKEYTHKEALKEEEEPDMVVIFSSNDHINFQKNILKEDHLKSHTKRNDIQGLRTLAVSSVLLFHLWPKVFVNGFLGVDM